MLLNDFIKEYNEIYHESFVQDYSNDTFSEVNKIQKILTSPKLYPTLEMKSFFKNIKEEYKAPLKICFIGDNRLTCQLFNVLLKDAALPLYPHLIKEKIVIKYASEYFVNAVLKDETIGINLFSNKIIKDVKYYEIFSPYEMLKDFEFYKEKDFDKKHIKDYDILILLLDFNSPYDIKYIAKKPTLAIINSNNQEEFLNYFALIKNNLDEEYKISQVIDLDIEMLFKMQGLYEKFSIFENLSLLETKLQSSGNDDDLSIIKDNLTNQDIINTKSIQFQKIVEITENIYQISQNAKINKNINMLKEILDKIRTVLKHYKNLLQHYSTLYTKYHKESRTLIFNIQSISNEYERGLHKEISIAIKSYLDSILKSVLENLEPIKLKVSQKSNSFLFAKKEVVFDTFSINYNSVFREVENTQSILSRKHRALISQINNFKATICNKATLTLDSMNALIDDLVKEGHYLTLQKKPSFISMNAFFDLEEFNANVYNLLIHNYEEIINEFSHKVSAGLVELVVWVKATQNLLLECIIRRVEQELQNNKRLMKSGNTNFTKIDSDFIIEVILDLLPSKLSNIFNTIYSPVENDELYKNLTKIRKNNQIIIEDRLKEFLYIKKVLKYSIKKLQDTIHTCHDRLDDIVN